jgi:hypothetical protein
MLAITPDAAVAIRALLDGSPLEDHGGLRLSPAQGEGGVALALADGPQEMDEVLTEQGVQVFLAPPLGERLDEHVLDARLEQGKVAFELLPQ